MTKNEFSKIDPPPPQNKSILHPTLVSIYLMVSIPVSASHTYGQDLLGFPKKTYSYLDVKGSYERKNLYGHANMKDTQIHANFNVGDAHIHANLDMRDTLESKFKHALTLP